jgi:Zn-dependent dipeptidase, microsomal dipeptidase homolog
MHDLLHAAPLIDGHNDLPFALRMAREKGGEPDVALPCLELQTDLPRLLAGAVGGQFWSVYVPSDLPVDEAVTQTLEQIDSLYELVRRYPATLEMARTAADVERIAAAGRVASMIGVEGGHSIGGSLGTLRTLARLGAGYMTLTHNDDIPWADSATGENPHGGLTRFGEEVVRELNRCGILVDLSHVSPDTMRQVIEVSEAPVIFSHSSARALCDVPRDVPDDVLESTGRTGGVVMVTFVPAFIAPEGAEMYALGVDEMRRLRVEHPDGPQAVSYALDRWFEANDVPATLSQVADHFDHVREIAGVDHLGVGSDFDGAPTMPQDLQDVSTFPALFAELSRRGYTDEELMKIAGRNILRVMRDAERISQQLVVQRPPSHATSASMDG